MSNLVKEKDYMWVVRAGQWAKYFEKFLSEKKGQSLFLWDWIKLSQSIENQEHLSS
jgi:hypothetical protein